MLALITREAFVWCGPVVAHMQVETLRLARLRMIDRELELAIRVPGVDHSAHLGCSELGGSTGRELHGLVTLRRKTRPQGARLREVIIIYHLPPLSR